MCPDAPYVNPQAGSLNVSPMNPPNMVESPENQGISPAGSVSNTNNQNVVTIQSFQNMTEILISQMKVLEDRHTNQMREVMNLINRMQFGSPPITIGETASSSGNSTDSQRDMLPSRVVSPPEATPTTRHSSFPIVIDVNLCPKRYDNIPEYLNHETIFKTYDVNKAYDKAQIPQQLWEGYLFNQILVLGANGTQIIAQVVGEPASEAIHTFIAECNKLGLLCHPLCRAQYNGSELHPQQMIQIEASTVMTGVNLIKSLEAKLPEIKVLQSKEFQQESAQPEMRQEESNKKPKISSIADVPNSSTSIVVGLKPKAVAKEKLDLRDYFNANILPDLSPHFSLQQNHFLFQKAIFQVSNRYENKSVDPECLIQEYFQEFASLLDQNIKYATSNFAHKDVNMERMKIMSLPYLPNDLSQVLPTRRRCWFCGRNNSKVRQVLEKYPYKPFDHDSLVEETLPKDNYLLCNICVSTDNSESDVQDKTLRRKGYNYIPSSEIKSSDGTYTFAKETLHRTMCFGGEESEIYPPHPSALIPKSKFLDENSFDSFKAIGKLHSGGKDSQPPSDSSSSSDGDDMPPKKSGGHHKKEYEESDVSGPVSKNSDTAGNVRPSRGYSLKELDTITLKIDKFGRNMKSEKLDGDLKKERCVEQLGKVLDEIIKDLFEDPVIESYLENETVQQNQYSLGKFNAKLARTVAQKDSVLLGALNASKNLKEEMKTFEQFKLYLAKRCTNKASAQNYLNFISFKRNSKSFQLGVQSLQQLYEQASIIFPLLRSMNLIAEKDAEVLDGDGVMLKIYHNLHQPCKAYIDRQMVSMSITWNNLSMKWLVEQCLMFESELRHERGVRFNNMLEYDTEETDTLTPESQSVNEHSESAQQMLSVINSSVKNEVKKVFKRYGSQRPPYRKGLKRNPYKPFTHGSNNKFVKKRSFRAVTNAENKVLNALSPHDPCFYCGEKGHTYRFCPKKPDLNDKTVQQKISAGLENWKRTQSKRLSKMSIDSFEEEGGDSNPNTSQSEAETDPDGDETESEESEDDQDGESDLEQESVEGDPVTTDEEQ